MSELDDLYRQLQYWKGEVTRLKTEKKKWENRKRDVESAQKSLRTVASNNSSDVNRAIDNANEKIDRSVEYPEKESMMDSIFSGKREKTVDADGNLVSANTQLGKEIGICRDKIDELSRAINTAQNNVTRIQREINSLRWV